MTPWLALGCSHTAGVALPPHDCYVSVLSTMLDRPVKNLGQPGGNADDVVQNLVQELKNDPPSTVILQWPNPIRRTIWTGTRPQRQNIHNAGLAFRQLLQSSEENFYQPWIQNIVVANMLCELANTHCINIMIEDIDAKYHKLLDAENIVLHVDQKLPDQTWLMDSAASDNLHHSARCHKQWAERIMRIFNEHTTR